MESSKVGRVERRDCARGPFCGVIDYQGVPGVYSIGVINISCSGVRVRLTGREVPGTIATLILSIPGEDGPISVTARVVWATPEEPYEAGLCFLDLSPALSQQIQRLTDQQILRTSVSGI